MRRSRVTHWLKVLGALFIAAFGLVVLGLAVVTPWNNRRLERRLSRAHQSSIVKYLALGRSKQYSPPRPLGRCVIVNTEARALSFPGGGPSWEAILFRLLFRVDDTFLQEIVAITPQDVTTVVLLDCPATDVITYNDGGRGYRRDCSVVLIAPHSAVTSGQRSFRGGDPPHSLIVPTLSGPAQAYGKSAEESVAVYLKDLGRATDALTATKIEAFWASKEFLGRQARLAEIQHVKHGGESYWRPYQGPTVEPAGVDEFVITAYFDSDPGYEPTTGNYERRPYTCHVKLLQDATWKLLDLTLPSAERK